MINTVLKGHLAPTEAKLGQSDPVSSSQTYISLAAHVSLRVAGSGQALLCFGLVGAGRVHVCGQFLLVFARSFTKRTTDTLILPQTQLSHSPSFRGAATCLLFDAYRQVDVCPVHCPR